MNSLYLYLFTASFSALVACFMTSIVSGIYAFFTLRRINETLKHPYLEHRAFHQYPLAIKLTILLDYFLRIAFPKGRFWLLGHANRLLPHVDPATTPLSVKWPLVGLWGGCWLGLLAMLGVWLSLLFA